MEEIKIVLASKNKGKIAELRALLSEYLSVPFSVLSLDDIGFDGDIEENGTTFEENAVIKALAIAALTDDIVLADDSGLEVDYLNKEPGIYSARYMGEDTPYSVKNQAILDRLQGVAKEERSARFVCAIAAVLPNKEVIVVRETIEGYIGFEIAGCHGFGYDPIFYTDELGCSTAEIPEEEKNLISHRGKALRAMREKLIAHGIK